MQYFSTFGQRSLPKEQKHQRRASNKLIKTEARLENTLLMQSVFLHHAKFQYSHPVKRDDEETKYDDYSSTTLFFVILLLATRCKNHYADCAIFKPENY